MTATQSTLVDVAVKVIDGSATAADRLSLVVFSRRLASATGLPAAALRRESLRSAMSTIGLATRSVA